MASAAADGRLIVETDNFIETTYPDPNPPLRVAFVERFPTAPRWGLVPTAPTLFNPDLKNVWSVSGTFANVAGITGAGCTQFLVNARLGPGPDGS